MRTLFSPEHEQFREQVRRFCEREIAPHYREWEKAGHSPRSFWRKAGEHGVLCTTIPTEYGGPGGDFLHACIVTEEMVRVGANLGIPVHSDMVSPYLLHYGSEPLKQRLLPRLCAGEIIGSIAMTEPGTGSDLKSIRTHAVRDGDEWVISGQKVWITNGFNCGVVLVACKTDPAAGAKGVSLIAVEEGTPGFTRSQPMDKIGLKAQDTAELFFDSVRVPASNPIIGFQNTRFKLAEAKAYITMLRTFVDACAAEHMAGGISSEKAAMAKLVATETMGRFLDEFLQLHGGYGYSAEYGIGRAWVDARVSRIAGGASEVLRDIISRNLGTGAA